MATANIDMAQVLESLQAGFSSLTNAMSKKRKRDSSGYSSDSSSQSALSDADSDYDSGEEIVKPAGDRWDEDSSQRDIQLRAIYYYCNLVILMIQQ